MSRLGFAATSGVLHLGLSVLAILAAWHWSSDFAELLFLNTVAYFAAFTIWFAIQAAGLRRFLGVQPRRTRTAGVAHLSIGVTVLATGFASGNPFVFLACLLTAASVVPAAATWWAAEPRA